MTLPKSFVVVLSSCGLRRFLAYCERNIFEVILLLEMGSAAAKLSPTDVSMVTSTSEAEPFVQSIGVAIAMCAKTVPIVPLKPPRLYTMAWAIMPVCFIPSLVEKQQTAMSLTGEM